MRKIIKTCMRKFIHIIGLNTMVHPFSNAYFADPPFNFGHNQLSMFYAKIKLCIYWCIITNYILVFSFGSGYLSMPLIQRRGGWGGGGRVGGGVGVGGWGVWVGGCVGVGVWVWVGVGGWGRVGNLPLRSWASYQIRKIAGCACAGNAGNISPRRQFQRKPLVSDPAMHHGTCVTHVPWCMSGSLTCNDGENVPGIPGACALAILRIWQEAHGVDDWFLSIENYGCNSLSTLFLTWNIVAK